MSKLVALDRKYWPLGGYGHWCAGCESGHEINVDAVNASGAIWSFNNDLRRPTFAPSINIRTGKYADPNYQDDGLSSVCHYFIQNGRIQYLSDSTHKLAGQTIDLPEIPAGKYLTSQHL